jgi:hypothetical protein
MNLKNNRNILLIGAAVLVVLMSFILYLTHVTEPYNSKSTMNFDQVYDTDIIQSVDIQNNALTNYFNSLYDSQISDIEAKYTRGLISHEERDKQLNAVIKNRDLTVKTLYKLSNTKKQLFMGNVTKQDILIRIHSFADINSDIKNEINATMYGY